MQTSNKKFSYFIKVCILFTLSLQLLSCKKFLDEKSDKSLITPNTLADLQALLDNNYIMNVNTSGFGETCADDYFVLPDDYNTLDANSQKAYTWNLKKYNNGGDWASGYDVIFNANYCLDELKQIEKTQANIYEWNEIKGSALFYRSYYFLNLIWDYGKAYDQDSSKKDLGIVLRLSSDNTIPSVRATVADCYDQVIKDLNEAAGLLPDKPVHPMRPSKAATYGALARTYLSMRMYDSAYKYADETLKIQSDLLDFNGSDVDPTSYVPFQPFNKEVIFYSTQSGNFDSKTFLVASIDTNLVASYDSNDLRLSVYFFPYISSYYSFKGNYSAALFPNYSGISTDEMILIRAECEARKDDVSDAMNDLNSLLVKRYRTGTFVPLAINDSKNALKRILLERRKELVMRGLRWIDIKRLNKEDHPLTLVRKIEDQTYTLLPNSDYYALPLPDDIIRLTGMKQN
ncbi:MAG TPA: RagB/SusD family nutrient uptake outer membrane protein [Hanamia sp.]|nr:RagB/SusD family nutrient uptake outer membrane protein [Hanamia sp.]